MNKIATKIIDKAIENAKTQAMPISTKSVTHKTKSHKTEPHKTKECPTKKPRVQQNAKSESNPQMMAPTETNDASCGLSKEQSEACKRRDEMIAKNLAEAKRREIVFAENSLEGILFSSRDYAKKARQNKQGDGLVQQKTLKELFSKLLEE